MFFSGKSYVVASISAVASFMACASHAEPPPVGSEQWNLLAPYSDFIRAMKTPAGDMGCCDMSDGRAELRERAAGDGYKVYITKDLYPSADIPGEGMWIDVQPEDVLTSEDARRFCAQYQDKANHSCRRPPFNVLWLNIHTNEPYCYIPRPSMY